MCNNLNVVTPNRSTPKWQIIKIDNHRWIHQDPAISVDVPLENVDFSVIEEDAHRVIVAAVRVEDLFIKIISSYLEVRNSQRQPFFDRELLQASWCSFAVKKQIVMSLIKEEKLLSSKELGALDREVQQLMRFRNAFAHAHWHAQLRHATGGHDPPGADRHQDSVECVTRPSGECARSVRQ